MDGGQLTFLVTRSSSSQHDGEGPSLKVQGRVDGFRQGRALGQKKLPISVTVILIAYRVARRFAFCSRSTR